MNRAAMAAMAAACSGHFAGTFKEAVTENLQERIELLHAALAKHVGREWVHLTAVYPDRVVTRGGPDKGDGRTYAYPYTISESNEITFGDKSEVVTRHEPVTTLRESVNACFVEADDGKFLVRVIRAGRSKNKVEYPRAVLREAAPRFNGAKVFAKADIEHVRGLGKDISRLVGRLDNARFVEGDSGGGEIQAELTALDSNPITAFLREAVAKNLTDAFGLSIDAQGRHKRRPGFIEATSIDVVSSVDLIVDPGAGGQVLRFVEALHEDSDMKLREQMLADIRKKDAKRADALESADDNEVLTAYREACAPASEPEPAPTQTGSDLPDAVEQRIRMVEARGYARTAIAGAQLPQQAKDRLTKDFDGRISFREADVDAAIKAEGEYLGSFREARIEGLGSDVTPGEDQSEKIRKAVDSIFDPEARSGDRCTLREAYIMITGDQKVTGRWDQCNPTRLREAVGGHFREAVSAATFGEIMGDSITRRMVADYNNLEAYQDWRWLTGVPIPLNDFRTNRRTRMGGYGNLPAVAENGSYNALSTPTDEEATYAATKRGGKETLSFEAIKNDDMGAVMAIPRKLAVAAGRTLYEFVHDFLANNAAIYDAVALIHASHNNLGAAALDATSFAAARLAMKQQTELDSAKRLGITLRHLAVPSDLEEAAYDLFVRNSNNDETFVQSRKPTVHVIDYWTDVNNWFAAADAMQCPLIEIGFLDGQEEPELFIQDNPTQGSLFSNDQILYKIRHIYGGAVIDYRGLYGAIVA